MAPKNGQGGSQQRSAWLCYTGIFNEAYKKAINVKYIRLPDLLYDLDQARAKGNYKKKLRALSRIELLIIDEFLLTPTTSVNISHVLHHLYTV